MGKAHLSHHTFYSLARTTGTPQVRQDDIYCVWKDIPIFQLYIVLFLILKFECPFVFLLQKESFGWMLLERRTLSINHPLLVKVIKVVFNLPVRTWKKA